MDGKTLKTRVVTSVHDFTLFFGTVSLLMVGLYLTGYIEGLVKWHTSDNMAALNMEYAGTIKGRK